MKIELRVNLNSGAALIIWALGVFGILWMAQVHPSIERLFPVALTGWTGGFGSYLLKRKSNHTIDLEAKKIEIRNGKTGDPLT